MSTPLIPFCSGVHSVKNSSHGQTHHLPSFCQHISKQSYTLGCLISLENHNHKILYRNSMQSENLTLFFKALILFLDMSISVVSKNFAYSSLNLFGKTKYPIGTFLNWHLKFFIINSKKYANL